MSRARKLLIVLTVVLSTASVAVLTQAKMDHKGTPPCDNAACDSRCKKWCPTRKSSNGLSCIFAGCLETTGECTYSCF